MLGSTQGCVKMNLASFFLIILTSFGLSCSDLGDPKRYTNPIGLPDSLNYVPGRVIVGFVDSVNFQFIASFISGLNLEPINIQADSAFSVWIQVESGDVNQHLARLQQDSAVLWADQRGYEGGDPEKSYLLARFRGTVKPEYAVALINSVGGLSWKRTIFSPRSALIKVQIGREQQWIDSLKTYPFVRWAELDYFTYSHLGCVPPNNAMKPTEQGEKWQGLFEAM
jgi:hypothetical protein